MELALFLVASALIGRAFMSKPPSVQTLPRDVR
jgi:hypothetical protein